MKKEVAIMLLATKEAKELEIPTTKCPVCGKPYISQNLRDETCTCSGNEESETQTCRKK